MPRSRPMVAVVLILSMASNLVFASEIRDPLGVHKDQSQTGAAEYVYRNDSEEILVPVFVLGAVQRPGLYHIPVKTDFVTLLALTGGPMPGAQLDEITIKKSYGKEVQVVDLEKLVSTPNLKSPALNNNDVILVKTEKPAVSSNTTLVIGLITSLLTVGVLAITVSKTK
ncbi:MAG: SLBB domain-containing protein [Deltaproteobacteria bacterium]|nr:SLBB domain-containing protein [Deltaproteobacteria bacterium]